MCTSWKTYALQQSITIIVRQDLKLKYNRKSGKNVCSLKIVYNTEQVKTYRISRGKN